MELSRKFETGDEGSTQSDLKNRIGRFYYDVPVAFRGDLTKVGGKLASRRVHDCVKLRPWGHGSRLL
jgi:hypothetical protein